MLQLTSSPWWKPSALKTEISHILHDIKLKEFAFRGFPT